MMELQPFKLERYFAKYEFAVKHLLSVSDGESMTLSDLLAMATDEQRAMWDNLWLGYTESQGHPALLEAIAELYDGVMARDVIEIVPEEGIFIAMNTLVGADDHVIVTHPGYQSLYHVAEARGCDVSKWSPVYDDGGWRFDVDELESLIQPDTKLIVFNFPHNPTGALISKAEFDRIIDLARERNIIVFSDEMYRYSEYDAGDRLPSACAVYENAVTLCGLSKSFGLPGLRTGWLATRNPDLLQKFAALKDYTTICASAPAEILALIALKNRDYLIERSLAIVGENLRTLDRFFETYSDWFDWSRPKAGTIAFAELKADVAIETFAQGLLERKGTLLVPSAIFDYPGNFFRLGFGRRNLPEALAQLEAFVKETL
jgi:aspartate/methionine/tyrosine aminotransferase